MSRFVDRLLRRGLPALLFGALLLATSLVGPGSVAHAALDHVDGLLPFERDVYVIAGVSLRNPTNDTPDTANLFNEDGVALNLTWGQWKAATATATAHAAGKQTDVRIHEYLTQGANCRSSFGQDAMRQLLILQKA